MIFKPKEDGDNRQWEQVTDMEGGFFTLVDWRTFEQILHGRPLSDVHSLTVGTHERIKQIVVSADGISVFTERRDA